MGKFIGQVGLQYLWGKIKYYFVTALGTSGNYLTWTKNGTTNNITVPFATTSSKVGTSTVGSYQRPVYINSGTPTVVSGVNERYIAKGYLSDEGYIAADLVPSLLPLIDTTAGNKLALLPPSQVIIEKTTDGGITWVDAEVSNSAKQTLFLGTDAVTNVTIPLLNGVKNKLCGIRITITGMKYNVPEGTTETNKYQYWNKNYLNKTERYVSLSGVYIWLSSNSDRIRTRVKCATGNNPDTWIDADNGNNAYLQGWTGGNYIFLKDLVFGGNTDQPQNYWNYRLEFFTDGNNGGNLSTSNTTSAQYVCRICGYGRNGWVLPNNLMKLNHLYTWDTELTMITKSVRPDTNNTHNLGSTSWKWANVHATTFHGSLDGNANTATKATQDASGNVITSTYAPKASPVLTGTPTAPTAAAGTNTTQIATTAFVKTAVDNVTSLAPLQTKTYTGVLGTAEDWTNATFFFASIKPTGYYDEWRIKYHIHVFVPGKNGYNQTAEVMISGDQSAMRAYSSMNTVATSCAYYHVLYRAKSAGINNGYGHALGIRLLSSTNPITAGYERTVEIELYEMYNCTVTFFDSCLKYANIPGTGSTNYDTYTEMNFVNNGLQETGDNNDVNYQNRIYYTSSFAAENIYRYQLLLRTKDNKLLPVSSANNVVGAANKTYSSGKFDPFGEIYYYNSTTTKAADAALGNAVLYRQVLVDARYAFDISASSTSRFDSRKPVYLTATLQSDGTAILTKPAGSTIGPLALDLPSTADGLIYIFLGMAYEDSNPYRFELLLNHPVYYHDGDTIKTLSEGTLYIEEKINTLEEVVLEDEEIVATSLVDLNNRLDTVLLDLEDDEQAIAGALTDLNEKIDSSLDVFIVTADLNSQSNSSAPVDKSVSEVIDALEDGKIVLLVMNTLVVPCIGVLNINNTTTVMYTASLGDSVIVIGLLNSTIQWETVEFNSIAFNGISKGTTTGSGNAVTDISVNNTGEITLTKGTTFLTSHLDISGKQDKISAVEFEGSISRNNVSGSGNISISGTYGNFPSVTSSGDFVVKTKMASSTNSYTLNVTFGSNTYSLAALSGIISDIRTLTLASGNSWSGSLTGTVAAGTRIFVEVYKVASSVSTIGIAAVSNSYDDLDDLPDVPSKVVVVDASSSMPSTLDPNKVYNFGTLTGTVTIPAFSSIASGDTEAKIWCFTFNTSTTAPTITWPAGITAWDGGSAPIIGVSMKYEVSVMNGLGIVIES